MRILSILGVVLALAGATAWAQFGTNYPASIAPGNVFATNHPGSLTASNSFGTNAPGWLTASNWFGTNAPGHLTNGSPFTGGAQRIGIVATNVVTVGVTNSTTNFVVLTGAIGSGSYYSTTNASVPYSGTNGIFFSYNPSAGGMYVIENATNQLYSLKAGSASAAGTYGDNGYGACVVSNGAGTFSWIATTNTTVITTNYP